MFLTLRYNRIILAGLMVILSFLLAAQVSLAEDVVGSKKALEGLDTTAKGGFGSDITSSATLPETIGKIVGVVLSFLGVIFFCIILYAGLSWVLSLGNEEKITQAKNMIIAAVLGLMVVLGAYAITNLIPLIFTDAVPK